MTPGLESKLTVVIPTLDAAPSLTRCIAALGSGVRIVVADGGSKDATAELARMAGASLVTARAGRGTQLAEGARSALSAAPNGWLLFLHADTLLDSGWKQAALAFMTNPHNRHRAAVFRFALDDDGPQARRLMAMVAWRVRWLGLPYGDQGLLIHADFYRAIGGYQDLPLMEDVAIIRRIGRSRLSILQADAVTSADRWRTDGWWWRSTRNVICLGLYVVGVPPARILKIYHWRKADGR